MISFEKIRPGPKMRTKHKLSKEVKSTWEIYHDTVIYAYQRTYRNTHTHIITEKAFKFPGWLFGHNFYQMTRKKNFG